MYPDGPNVVRGHPNKIEQSNDGVNHTKFPISTSRIWNRLAYENNVTTEQILEILRYARVLRQLRTEFQSVRFDNISSSLFVSFSFVLFKVFAVIILSEMDICIKVWISRLPLSCGT